jgi:hypothetical protein
MFVMIRVIFVTYYVMNLIIRANSGRTRDVNRMQRELNEKTRRTCGGLRLERVTPRDTCYFLLVERGSKLVKK